jgi:NAD(P)-dependent dehydrogenase (short-subunit alcohol dehydrogenase family)
MISQLLGQWCGQSRQIRRHGADNRPVIVKSGLGRAAAAVGRICDVLRGKRTGYSDLVAKCVRDKLFEICNVALPAEPSNALPARAIPDKVRPPLDAKLGSGVGEKMLAINLTGVWLCMKHEIVQMLAQGGGGAIVNTASIAGLIGLATSGHYVAAKHGVVGLTKTAAIEYAQDAIRVNCVNPGYITTPMTKEVVETRLDAVMAKVPMNRMGAPDEIAEAVVWMCSDKASFMTGASQVVDGGYYAA